MSDLLPCPFCGEAPSIMSAGMAGQPRWQHPVNDTCPIAGHYLGGWDFPVQWNQRALPAVQPATDPDYCYDEAWEYTMPWGDRNTLVEWADLTKPVPIYTLIKGPTKWAVNIPLDTDGDGEADDFELTWFDSEDAALAALKGETP